MTTVFIDVLRKRSKYGLREINLLFAVIFPFTVLNFECENLVLNLTSFQL